MGHEFAGEITAIGSAVTGWKIGQRVAVFNLRGCGSCESCQSNKPQCCPTKKLIGVNTGPKGAFAEYVTVWADAIREIAPSISDDEAILNEPLSVALHALKLLPDHVRKLVIVGGGTIGQCITQVAKVMGRFDIIVLEPLAEKRAIAEKYGAKALPPDLSALREIWPAGAEGAIEAVGVNDTVNLGLEAIGPSGTLVLLGNLAKSVTLPLQQISSAEKRLVGSYGFNRQDFDQVIDWINQGKFDLKPMLSGECSLADTPAVFADLAEGRRQAIKIVVHPW